MKLKYPFENPQASSIETILSSFETNIDNGITEGEAITRTKEYGLNIYQTQKQKRIITMIIEQFTSPINYLLVLGVAVSFYFGDFIEGVAIGIVILINALIGFLMELQARNSMNALKKMDIILCKIIRDGKLQEIPSENLTLGDLVVLEAGDIVPGDGRLVELNQLQCDESSLTGESLPIEKNLDILQNDTALGDMLNMVFKGTSVINGSGKAIVTGIAQNTQLGIITSLVESSDETETPLDKKLNALAARLIWLTLLMTLVFAISGFCEGEKWIVILKSSIALAVAAFPEGLPIVSTVALSYGMLYMAKHKVIVKTLSSVETLGSTTVILTDKTGTLTENKIYVDTLSFPTENLKVHIEKGTLIFENGDIKISTENFDKLKLIGALCNNSVQAQNIASVQKQQLGDPIDIALIQLASSSNSEAVPTRRDGSTVTQYERIKEVPFNSIIKLMGTLHKNSSGFFVACKGSVEHLVEKCDRIQSGVNINDFNKDLKNKMLSESEKMSAQGLRVLAFAYREGTDINKDDFLKNLIYVGMIGFLDIPRSDIKRTIISCKKAGIKVVMVTGDHPMTALNIAQRIGLVDETEKNVINGKDLPPLTSLSDEWRTRILSSSVFARTTPKQKLEIADVFQKAGNIIAMTGDGVNDAPALKKADVGIAMGIRGTQVAKETANIILKNDSFASIINAIAQGRVIFKNIQKFVIYLVSCNLSEIFVITAMGFIEPASILFPLQILFLNMVTDVFPALALGLGRGEKSIMQQPPKNPNDPIISNKKWIEIGFYAIIITFSVFAAIIYCQKIMVLDSGEINSVAFATLIFAQLFHVFNMSSAGSKLLINEITKNKFVWLAISLCAGATVFVFALPRMRTVLNLKMLPTKVWIVSILASLLPLLFIQLYRRISYRNIQIENKK